MSKITDVEFTIGCDPELMLVDAAGALKSAIPVISGTKEAPLALEGGGMVSHDNVLVEYGTRPAKTEDEFVAENQRVLQAVAKLVGKAGLVLVVRASASYPAIELELDEAKVFGCDPDFNPYEMEVNEINPAAAFSPFRTAGGHIHIGHQRIADEMELLVEAAKAYDAFITLPFMLVSKDPTSAKRRQLYGKAGAHRPKPYGIEYRAIDNYWVASPKLTRLVYRLTRDGLRTILSGHTHGLSWDKVRNIVNEGDITAAQATMNGYLRRMLSKDTQDLFNEVVDTPMPNLYKEWEL